MYTVKFYCENCTKSEVIAKYQTLEEAREEFECAIAGDKAEGWTDIRTVITDDEDNILAEHQGPDYDSTPYLVFK